MSALDVEISEFPINDKKTINGWAIFDWANSSYALVITVAVFPAYFSSITADNLIPIGKYNIEGSSLFAFSISLAYFIILLLSPPLSGIADYGGKRKSFMKFFTYMGGLSCIALFFFKGMDQLAFGTICFILSTIGFAGALVFYNSYLPQIVTEDQLDRVSAKGYSYGFIGSVILLILNLIIMLNPGWFGIPEGSSLPIRIAFVMVGLWWIGFAQITFKRLPGDSKVPFANTFIKQGFKELRNVWQQVRQGTNIKRFLISFFFYSAGAQTVLFLASTFAEEELNFGTTELLAIIVLLQFLGIIGAIAFAKLSDQKGNKLSLFTMLIIWMLICFFGSIVTAKFHFYILAGAVGLVMGGIQALSRSTYAKLIPAETDDTTSFYSFYDVLEKGAIIIGTFTFGIIGQITGNMRYSLIVLTVFFIIGIIVLSLTKIQRLGFSEQ